MVTTLKAVWDMVLSGLIGLAYFIGVTLVIGGIGFGLGQLIEVMDIASALKQIAMWVFGLMLLIGFWGIGEMVRENLRAKKRGRK